MRKQRTLSQTQLIIEQIALLFASFVWTSVILSVIILVWAIQDIESNWDVVLGNAPSPTPALELAVFFEPTETPWPTRTPTAPPTETLIPTETPTLVVQPPSILPDTPNLSDPIPVVVHTQGEIADYIPGVITASIVSTDTTSLPTQTPIPDSTATNTPNPTATAIPTFEDTSISDGSLEPTLMPTATPVPPTATPIPPSPTPVLSAATPTPPLQVAQVSPSRLIIPAVNIDTTVTSVGWSIVEQGGVRYSIWQVADYAVGWHKTSAIPGQVGNMVMAGHHNIKGEVFRDLVNVEVGDEVTVYVGNIPYNYKVELKTIVKEKGESLEVRQRNAEWIAPTTDERLTLVTCWPYTNNTHRVIVVAKPI